MKMNFFFTFLTDMQLDRNFKKNVRKTYMAEFNTLDKRMYTV